MTTPRPGHHASPAALFPARPAGEQAGSRPDRKEVEIRRMLEVPHPPTPPDLADRAMARGRRLLRRRRARHTVLWTVLALAVLSAAVALWHSSPGIGVTPPMPGP